MGRYPDGEARRLQLPSTTRHCRRGELLPCLVEVTIHDRAFRPRERQRAPVIRQALGGEPPFGGRKVVPGGLNEDIDHTLMLRDRIGRQVP